MLSQYSRADEALVCGHPVEHDVGEELIAGEGVRRMAVAVAPGPELLHDPGQQAGRRIVEGHAQGLWLGALFVGIARLLAPEPLHGGEVRLLLVGERPGSSGGEPERHVEVDGRAMLRVEAADPGRTWAPQSPPCAP